MYDDTNCSINFIAVFLCGVFVCHIQTNCDLCYPNKSISTRFICY